MNKPSTFNSISTLFAALVILGNSMAIAATPTDVSFSAVNSFDDRFSAFIIEGIDKDSGNGRTLTLYRFVGRIDPGNIRSHEFGNGTAELLSRDNSRHVRCYDYLLKMLDEPGKYFLTLHLSLRDDPSDFSRGSSDRIDSCNLERQSPTLP